MEAIRLTILELIWSQILQKAKQITREGARVETLDITDTSNIICLLFFIIVRHSHKNFFTGR